MSEPYLGEIRIFGFNFAPYQWAFCDGGLLPVQQYAALYSIIGTTFGGNGTTNFALPNFQGRAPMHWGSGPGLTPRVWGEVDGSTTETLTNDQIPSHTHILMEGQPNPANTAQQTNMPGPTAFFSTSAPNMAYSDKTTPPVAFSPMAISQAGGGLPHNNMQPIVTLNFCIALFGVFPARN